MGGPVRIGVRYRGNIKYCGLCWTGDISFLFQSKEFFEDDIFLWRSFFGVIPKHMMDLLFQKGMV